MGEGAGAGEGEGACAFINVREAEANEARSATVSHGHQFKARGKTRQGKARNATQDRVVLPLSVPPFPSVAVAQVAIRVAGAGAWLVLPTGGCCHWC